MRRVIYLISDSLVIAKRNLIKIKRVPEVLVFVLLSPIMFVLLFAYVFGGSIDIPGGSYREFLIAGIFAQTVIFGATFTGAGLAEDMQKGIIDRFRSLPMSQSAVLVGRTASDIVYNVLTLTIMGLTGLVVGWRMRGSLWDGLAGFALLLAFAYAFSWVMAYVGLLVPSVEVVNNAQLHGDLPAHFYRQHFRSDRESAFGAENLRGMEPDLGGNTGSARFVRKHPARNTRAHGLAPAESGDLLSVVVGGDHCHFCPTGVGTIPQGRQARLTPDSVCC